MACGADQAFSLTPDPNHHLVDVLVDGKVIVDTLEKIVAYDHPWIRHYFHGARGRALGVRGEDSRGT